MKLTRKTLTTHRPVTCLALLLLATSTPVASAQQSTPATAQVTKGDFSVAVNLPGVFVADNKDEIKLEPSKYRGDLIVTRITPEGTFVNKGDVLIEFDADKLDEAIVEAQNEATDAQVELKKADAEFQSAQIDLDAKQSHAKTELRFLERDVMAAVAKQALEMAEKEKAVVDSIVRIDNLRVDLDTLIKIYQERNLNVSNSGDILIEREKNRINSGEKNLDFKQKELEYFRKFDQSKAQLEKELDVEKKRAEIKKQKVTLEAAVAEKRSVVTKAQRSFDAASRKVSGLQSDRQQLRVVAPRNGVLFYGQTGKELPAGVVVFGGARTDIRKELRIGGRVQTHKILMTISEMDNLSIKMSVAEDDIQHLTKDLAITVYPDAFPATDFPGALTKVDPIATKIGFSSTERRFKVMGKCNEKTPDLRSGMNCRVAIASKPVHNALQVPVQSVFRIDGAFVCFVKLADRFEKRKVRIGLSNAQTVHITDGLSEGETVCLSKPPSTD